MVKCVSAIVLGVLCLPLVGCMTHRPEVKADYVFPAGGAEGLCVMSVTIDHGNQFGAPVLKVRDLRPSESRSGPVVHGEWYLERTDGTTYRYSLRRSVSGSATHELLIAKLPAGRYAIDGLWLEEPLAAWQVGRYRPGGVLLSFTPLCFEVRPNKAVYVGELSVDMTLHGGNFGSASVRDASGTDVTEFVAAMPNIPRDAVVVDLIKPDPSVAKKK